MEMREEEGIKIFTVRGAQDGPRFTVFGGVHGNETCGPKALERVLKAIEEERIRITKGTFTIVPIANPQAYEKGVRFIDRNLNRYFYPKLPEEIKHYEDSLDNTLCRVLEVTDYFLDLHSYTSMGEAFGILGGNINDKKNVDFAKSLGVPRLAFGWEQAVSASKDVQHPLYGQGTTEYVRKNGATAITLECGNHFHPRAADVGFQAVLNVLKSLGMAEIDPALHITDINRDPPVSMQIAGAVMRTREGKFLVPMNNMDFFKKDTSLAQYDDGETLTMPEDGYIIMPHEKVVRGEEWYFWARRYDL